MSKQVLFISVDELKDKSIIQTNVDEKLLSQSIVEFQELEIRELIGKPTYQRLSNAIVENVVNGVTYSTSDAALLEIIKPVMVYGSLLYSLTALHFKVSNKGIQKLNDNNATTGDRTDIEAIRANYNFKLDRFKKRLSDYLRVDNDETTKPNGNIDTSFGISGIYLPDNTFDYAKYYKDSAYKTGGRWRGFC